MRYAKIENDVVTNVIIADEAYITNQTGTYVLSDTANIGDKYVNQQFIKTSPPKEVPQSIAMWQARDVMIKHGILDDVINFINNIPDIIERKRAQSKFEFSNTVRRDDSLLNFVATQAGYTKDQIDDWFIEGEKL